MGFLGDIWKGYDRFCHWIPDHGLWLKCEPYFAPFLAFWQIWVYPPLFVAGVVWVRLLHACKDEPYDKDMCRPVVAAWVIALLAFLAVNVAVAWTKATILGLRAKAYTVPAMVQGGLEVIQVNRLGNSRWCISCNSWMPMRWNHCSEVGMTGRWNKCLPQLHHVCVWFGAPVYAPNIKSYMMGVLWFPILQLFSLGVAIWSLASWKLRYWFSYLMMAQALISAIGIPFSIHTALWAVMLAFEQNQLPGEYRNKATFFQVTNIDPAHPSHGKQHLAQYLDLRHQVPFSQGYKANVKSIIGPWWHLLLPAVFCWVASPASQLIVDSDYHDWQWSVHGPIAEAQERVRVVDPASEPELTPDVEAAPVVEAAPNVVGAVPGEPESRAEEGDEAPLLQPQRSLYSIPEVDEAEDEVHAESALLSYQGSMRERARAQLELARRPGSA